MEATLEPRLVMKGEEGKALRIRRVLRRCLPAGVPLERNEVRQLLDDIQANAREAKARRAFPDDYYLQPIVVLDRKDGTWELVDGQQRLTTLFLITKFISTKLPEAKSRLLAHVRELGRKAARTWRTSTRHVATRTSTSTTSRRHTTRSCSGSANRPTRVRPPSTSTRPSRSGSTSSGIRHPTEPIPTNSSLGSTVTASH